MTANQSFFTTSSIATQPIARYESPSLSLNKSLSIEQVMSTIQSWNDSLQRSLPGIGFYGADPQADTVSSDRHHFVLIADEVFFKAFMEIHEEIQVTSVPAEDLQQSAA